MAFTFTGYSSLLQRWHDGTIDADNDPIKLALITNAYIPDFAAHTIFADVSAEELPAGNNYAAGGIQLTNPVVSVLGFDADDLTFVNLGSPAAVTFRYGILYVDATVNLIVQPIMGLILFDDTPADTIVASANFGVQWGTAGIFTFAFV